MKFFKKFLQPDEMGFITLVAVYVGICAAIAQAGGRGDDFSFLLYLRTGMIITFNCLTAYLFYRLIRAGYILVIQQPEKPLQALLDDLKKGPLRAELYKKALPIFIGFVFFFSTFTSMKMLMPRIHPFEWDEFFMNADRLIHFGADPWRLLDPFLGYPFVTWVIAFCYICWLPLFFIVLYWQLFRLRDPLLRLRFFYTFVLSWAINGTFFALLFSSAGPCFYERVLGSDYYAELMQYLAGVQEHTNIYALKTQDLLWENYINTGEIIGGGISAFPSVHIATAFLFVLMARHIGPKRFYAFVAFFIAIALGSVHLGWHYAVDGYFSIFSTAVLWWLMGKILEKRKAGAF